MAELVIGISGMRIHRSNSFAGRAVAEPCDPYDPYHDTHIAHSKSGPAVIVDFVRDDRRGPHQLRCGFPDDIDHRVQGMPGRGNAPPRPAKG